MDILAQRIREAREARGLSQAELAKLAGYTSRASINKIEKGLVDVPRSRVDAIAKALRVSPAWLLGLSDKGGASDMVIYINDLEPLLVEAKDATPRQIEETVRFLKYLKELEKKQKMRNLPGVNREV